MQTPHAAAAGEQVTDVAVVGGGMSGLATARLLAASGRSVTVLEARDRVGGRLDSIGGLDVGATWFWPNEPRVQALITETGIRTHPQYLDGDALYQDAGGVRRLDGNPIDVASGRFTDGADSLARAVADGLPDGTVQLGVEVRRVTGVEGGVVVSTSAGQLRAAHAVLALPPALALELIEFSPALPDQLARRARMTPVWMGAITKVVVRYPHAFWRRAGLSGSAISHVGPMREIHDMSGVDGVPAALFGFVPGHAVGQPTVTETAVGAQLVDLFGPDGAAPASIEIYDWRAARYTSPNGVERLTAYEAFGHDDFLQPTLDGRVHWASTETSTDFAGHIEGALEAAERVAQAIIAANEHDRVRPDLTDAMEPTT